MWMKEDNGNKDGKNKNDEGKDGKNNTIGINDQYSVIKSSNTGGKKINCRVANYLARIAQKVILAQCKNKMTSYDAD